MSHAGAVFAGVTPSLIHPSAMKAWNSSTVLGRAAPGCGFLRGCLHSTVELCEWRRTVQDITTSYICRGG